MGEAMASASGSQPSGGNNSGAGAKPSFRWLAAIALLVGCNDDLRLPAPHASATTKSVAAADPSEGVTTDLDGIAPAYSDGLLAELTGDDAAARLSFEKVLAAPDAPSVLAARAALHLAQLEARYGKTGRARDLIARATALAPSDLSITEGAAQLEVEVGLRGADDVRGPPLGTALPGVDPKVAAAFATAERALAAVHRMHPRPFIESLSTSVRAKEDATEEVVAKYRAVADTGGLAQVAAEYRIGSLYHDLALGLVFELPPELDPAVAAGLRRTLRGHALAYLHKAVTAYRACLAGKQGDAAEPWSLAAGTDVRAALDVLGEPNDVPAPR